MSKIKKWSKLQIESDGTSVNTFVKNEDGNIIEGVTSLEWKIEVGGIAEVKMTVLAPIIKVEGVKICQKN